MSLSWEQVKAASPLTIELDVPEWHGQITLRKWSAMDKLRFLEFQEPFEKNDNLIVNASDAIEASAEMLAMSIVDDAGVLSFDSDDAKDWLKRQDPRVLQPIVDAVISLNRLDVTLEGEIESAKKN